MLEGASPNQFGKLGNVGEIQVKLGIFDYVQEHEKDPFCLFLQLKLFKKLKHLLVKLGILQLGYSFPLPSMRSASPGS